MTRQDTALLVIDMQGKLTSLVQNDQTILWNIVRLLEGAKALGLPIVGTEQYPQGLGGTVDPIKPHLEMIEEKSSFSCVTCERLLTTLQEKEINKILLCGIEAHVCVLQSALDLMSNGFRLYIPIDAVGSRNLLDFKTALRRMENCGATLTSTEAALFEWCEFSNIPEFKTVSNLVKQTDPSKQT